MLKKNKTVADPCPSDMPDTIASELSAVMNALTPLKDVRDCKSPEDNTHFVIKCGTQLMTANMLYFDSLSVG